MSLLQFIINKNNDQCILLINSRINSEDYETIRLRHVAM